MTGTFASPGAMSCTTCATGKYSADMAASCSDALAQVTATITHTLSSNQATFDAADFAAGTDAETKFKEGVVAGLGIPTLLPSMVQIVSAVISSRRARRALSNGYAVITCVVTMSRQYNPSTQIADMAALLADLNNAISSSQYTASIVNAMSTAKKADLVTLLNVASVVPQPLTTSSIAAIDTTPTASPTPSPTFKSTQSLIPGISDANFGIVVGIAVLAALLGALLLFNRYCYASSQVAVLPTTTNEQAVTVLSPTKSTKTAIAAW
jgi:hypothetical protein